MTLETTVSAHPRALDRLAYPRYSRHWRLSSHASSCGDPIGISSVNTSKALMELYIIPEATHTLCICGVA